ncbi:hypothetical protein Q31b_07090 [Novipirellula aureliae]|uniref:Uncharacterized protein n=1 Tax=Novipirellula aureliae TaxID=2527966 RepID=A0A5C6EAJ2_9BACT|nr:hypothetical protein [Novipirellula aureliae]TWU45535.1 hypothetical protein Q31b_07090 [Novipirellula aureliae]
MFYFILWVVFLLTAVLAVPVVSFLEKRALAKPQADDSAATTNDEWTDEENGAPEEGFGSDDPFGGDVEVVEPLNEELASFEEIK